MKEEEIENVRCLTDKQEKRIRKFVDVLVEEQKPKNHLEYNNLIFQVQLCVGYTLSMKWVEYKSDLKEAEK